MKNRKKLLLSAKVKKIIIIIIAVILALILFEYLFDYYKEIKNKAEYKTETEKPIFKKSVPSLKPLDYSKEKEKKDIIKKDRSKMPKIAIIIDDIGYDSHIAEKFFEIDSNITFAILPLSPAGKKIAENIHSKNGHIMMHMPMEPIEKLNVNPGPGVLLDNMSPDKLTSQIIENLDSIPYIKGVNNHMGSKLTAISDRMNQVFIVLKKRELFFIDSLTTPDSQCKSSARLFKVKFAARDVFLDNIHEEKYIAKQLKQLTVIAKKKGKAIGICHPFMPTLRVLQKEIPKIREEINIVPAGSLTEVILFSK